uniref:Uncharacterized protein n=1 Tax=Hucho hucho TaxID=62062 RepID=A0A4W5JZC6_9TELE
MDNILYAEFLTWRNRPSLDRSSAFLGRLYREDIGPCLSFTRSEFSQSVQSAVENNSLTIEPVAMSALPMVKANAIECGGPKSQPCVTSSPISATFNRAWSDMMRSRCSGK